MHAAFMHASNHNARYRAFHLSSFQADPLAWHELYLSSTLARWAGLAYLPEGALEGGADDERLKIVAQGRNKYTSW